MQYTTGSVGKVIVMRLEEGDQVYPCIEQTAAAEAVSQAMVWIIGGVKDGKVVVGPDDRAPAAAAPFATMVESFTDRREIVGVGMLFPGSDGLPRLHMHAGLGKGDQPLVGCPRLGLDCWLVNEVVLMELCGIDAARVKDPLTGFELLKIRS
jgi:predicted DNA-binding protein with PD1-like motif